MIPIQKMILPWRIRWPFAIPHCAMIVLMDVILLTYIMLKSNNVSNSIYPQALLPKFPDIYPTFLMILSGTLLTSIDGDYDWRWWPYSWNCYWYAHLPYVFHSLLNDIVLVLSAMVLLLILTDTVSVDDWRRYYPYCWPITVPAITVYCVGASDCWPLYCWTLQTWLWKPVPIIPWQ